MSMAEILTTKLVSYRGYEAMNISYVTRTYTLALIGIRKTHQRSFWKSTHKIMKFSMSDTSYPCHAPTSIWEFCFAFPWEMVPSDNYVLTETNDSNMQSEEPVELCVALPTLGQILLQGVSHYLQLHHESSKPTANTNRISKNKYYPY